MQKLSRVRIPPPAPGQRGGPHITGEYWDRRILRHIGGRKTQKRGQQNMKIDKPFMKINEAAKATGLSSHYLRNAVRSGEIEYMRSGQTYYINMPRLLEKLGVADWPKGEEV